MIFKKFLRFFTFFSVGEKLGGRSKRRIEKATDPLAYSKA